MYQFTAPPKLVTDFGSQFLNDSLAYFHQETGINTNQRYRTQRVQQRENGTTKSLTDLHGKLCSTKVTSKIGHGTGVLNTSLEQSLGVSPNTLDLTDPLLTQITLTTRQAKLIDAAINEAKLTKTIQFFRANAKSKAAD